MSLKYRPLALAGFTVLLSLFASVFISDVFTSVSLVCGTVLFMLCIMLKGLRYKPYLYFLAGALILAGGLFTAEKVSGLDYAQSFADEESCRVDGYITDYPEHSSSRYYYSVETVSINGSQCKTKLRLSLPNEISAEPYDRISADLKLYLIGKTGGTDVEWYFRSKGIFLGAYVRNDEDTVKVIQNDDRPLRYSILKLKKNIEERILEKLPNEYGGTAVALLLGDKSFISDETKDKLYETGVAPVFAVSGLHLSIWVMGLYNVLQMLKVRKRLNSAVCLVFTVFFMALTGFSPSVCRSGLMMILLLSGHLIYRKTDSLNSLGFSAVILCCLNPFIVADTGFLLSFSATFGIVTLYRYADKYIISNLNSTVLKAFLSAVFVSLCAIIGSLPVTVLFLEYISVFSVVTNLLITYAAGACMVLAGSTALFFGIPVLSDMAAFLCGIIAKYILTVVNIFADFPVTAVSTADVFWKGGMIFCLAAVIFALISFKGRKAFKVSCACVGFVIFISAVSSYFYYDGLTEIEILDAGDGVAVAASYGNRKLLLLGETDGYNTVYTVEDCFDRISRRNPNLLLLSDYEASESQTALQLIKKYDFNKIVLPRKSQSVEALSDGERMITASDTDIQVWDSGKIYFVCDGTVSYAYCNFDNVTFLIVLKSDENSVIRDGHAKADFLVCSGYIPDNVDPADFSRVFISTIKKKSQSISKYISENGGSFASTSDYGNFSVKIRNGESRINVKEG